MDISINPELKSLIPPLSEDERSQLEQNLLENGCRDPLVVWDGVLLDGHNRYEICEQHGIAYETVSVELESIAEARVWMRNNQMGRRNLTPAWRIELALGNKEDLAKVGKGRMLDAGSEGGRGNKKGLSLSDKPFSEPKHNTQEEIAKSANTSTGMVGMAEVVRREAPEAWEKAKQGEVSVKSAYSDLKKQEKKAKAEEALHARSADKARKTAKFKNSLFDVRHGDFREVLSDIEQASLILTDPPYPKDSLTLWGDLGEWAANALANDGILVAYSGQLYLPQVLNMLSEHLDYWWCGAVVHKGSGNLTPLSHPVRKVINQWKPLVMFYKKGGYGFERTFRDLVDGTGAQKTDHNWQQPVEEAKIIVENFTKEGELVVDPFAGSGGFCKAAHDLGRIAVGAEILSNE